MKNSAQCPKCKSREILKIPFLRDNNGQNAVNTGFFVRAKVTRYVCATCGFTEEWIDNINDLEKIREKFKESRI